MKVGDIYFNPYALDLWILRKDYLTDSDNEEWILSLVHSDYQEEYLAVKGFIKIGNIYEMVEQQKQIGRLNNIIKRFEEDLREMYLTFGEFSEEYTEKKIKELKEIK